METFCIKYKCNRKLFNIIIALAILLLISFSIILVGSNPISKESENEIYAILYFLGASGTFLLCIIAWIQLESIKRELDGTFFIELTKMSRDPLYYEAELILFKILKNNKSEDRKKHLSDEISKLEKKKPDEYLKLIHFLNYLELMGYFYHKNYIKIEEFDKIKGTIILDYYALLNGKVLEVFSGKNPLAMELFKKLAEDLEMYKKEKKSSS